MAKKGRGCGGGGKKKGMLAALVLTCMAVAGCAGHSPTPPAPPPAPPCPGDCNGDGSVTVDELLRVVNILHGMAPLASCPAADADGSGELDVTDLIAIVTVLNAGTCP